MTKPVQFYFSFRSTYSYLAFYRIRRLTADYPVSFEYCPVFPPQDFARKQKENPGKLSYLRKDFIRIAKAYGLTIQLPEPFDTEWRPPHAAFLYAAEHDKGPGFALAAFNKRFLQGEDIADKDVLKTIAAECHLDPEELHNASADQKRHADLTRIGARAREVGLFGVPYFIYKDNTYWGNDRLEWLLREIALASGREVPDLQQDPLQRPF
ncbi:MAG: 2-hydroxychromene-2-carboxylate isomerase [Gammaproteobacteria bacterium]